MKLIIFVLFTFITSNSLLSNQILVKQPVDEEKETYLISSIKLTRTNENIISEVDCFDISEEGIIATGIGLENRQKYIRVFTEDNDFLYGFFFYTDGAFLLEWNDENLCIYLVRSNYYVTINSDGNVLDVEKIELTKNNRKYINNVLWATEKTVGNKTYSLKDGEGIHTIFIATYSRLHITENGVEKVIILNENPVDSFEMGPWFFIILYAWIFVATIILCIGRIINKIRKGKKLNS